jgi:hypothetical protein
MDTCIFEFAALLALEVALFRLLFDAEFLLDAWLLAAAALLDPWFTLLLLRYDYGGAG